MQRHKVLLVQLPIPPLGPGTLRGNVPLAAAYLKMYAELQGLASRFSIDILPTVQSNYLGDVALVEAILHAQPWLIGFTCYLWNIERTLWIAQQIKARHPEIVIVIGGPEVTRDNAWVLHHPAVDYAVIGEGEQTFADLLPALESRSTTCDIAGLFTRPTPEVRSHALPMVTGPQFTNNDSFKPRRPLPRLDLISSPYLTGILDAADEQMLLLETIRGCSFKCKFCYYPKSYDGLYFLSEEKIIANLQHALARDAKEVVFLDPTLNQRKDFDGFLQLLIRNNPQRRLTFFGELRAEGIKESTADLLAEAGFTEGEVGLQSIDPLAMQLIDRKNNLKAVERGCRAMLAAGIKVKVDLIIGLPGDTVDSVRRSMHYLRDSGIYSDVQVFNLAILPGTAFRQEAPELGLVHQPSPPYYVRRTPSLRQEDLFDLMREAADVFELEWDPLLDPVLPNSSGQPCNGQHRTLHDHVMVDLLHSDEEALPPASQRSQAFTLWFRSPDFRQDINNACQLITRLLDETPFSTLQVVLEPTGPGHLTESVLSEIWDACQAKPSYLDRYYALQPGRPIGAKRVVVLLPADDFAEPLPEWLEEQATVVRKKNGDSSRPPVAGNEVLIDRSY
jgi:radical SAM superfamily enzyme YgiQ (UPF0313 family)